MINILLTDYDADYFVPEFAINTEFNGERLTISSLEDGDGYGNGLNSYRGNGFSFTLPFMSYAQDLNTRIISEITYEPFMG